MCVDKICQTINQIAAFVCSPTTYVGKETSLTNVHLFESRIVNHHCIMNAVATPAPDHHGNDKLCLDNTVRWVQHNRWKQKGSKCYWI